MLAGGILGALILPALSDRFRKRKLFLVVRLAGMIPGLFALAFAGKLSTQAESIYNIMLAGSFILGFFVMSAGPIGFQYAAEVCAPAPESASQSVLLWVGQITGMVFVAGMSMKNNAFLGDFMALFAGLSIVALIFGLMLRESPLIGMGDWGLGIGDWGLGIGGIRK